MLLFFFEYPVCQAAFQRLDDTLYPDCLSHLHGTLRQEAQFPGLSLMAFAPNPSFLFAHAHARSIEPFRYTLCITASENS